MSDPRPRLLILLAALLLASMACRTVECKCGCPLQAKGVNLEWPYGNHIVPGEAFQKLGDDSRAYLTPNYGSDLFFCPECQKQGLTSTVTQIGATSCTAMFCGNGYYDEGGRFIAPRNCNSCYSSYRCSNGHEFTR